MAYPPLSLPKPHSAASGAPVLATAGGYDIRSMEDQGTVDVASDRSAIPIIKYKWLLT